MKQLRLKSQQDERIMKSMQAMNAQPADSEPMSGENSLLEAESIDRKLEDGLDGKNSPNEGLGDELKELEMGENDELFNQLESHRRGTLMTDDRRSFLSDAPPNFDNSRRESVNLESQNIS